MVGDEELRRVDAQRDPLDDVVGEARLLVSGHDEPDAEQVVPEIAVVEIPLELVRQHLSPAHRARERGR